MSLENLCREIVTFTLLEVVDRRPALWESYTKLLWSKTAGNPRCACPAVCVEYEFLIFYLLCCISLTS